MALELIHSSSDSLRVADQGNDFRSFSYALQGHAGEVLSVDFSSTGTYQSVVNLCANLGDFVASAGLDRTILLWSVTEGLSNFATLRGHTNAILQVKWVPSDSTKLFTCGADKCVSWWDSVEGARIKKLKGHASIVNCCGVNKFGSPVGVSGSDDGTVKLWDMRERNCVGTFEHSYQILSVDCSENGDRIFAGTIDDSVLMLDSRKLESPLEILGGIIEDSVTGVSVSNDGDYLLSVSMNGSANLWDIRPFCEQASRDMYTYTRITNNFEMNLIRIRWSPDDLLFSVGSSDHALNVHKVRPDISDMDSQLLMIPNLHDGCVNEVVFHPKERYTVATASSDKTLMYGPLVL